jgi:hypothetical protein
MFGVVEVIEVLNNVRRIEPNHANAKICGTCGDDAGETEEEENNGAGHGRGGDGIRK